MPHIFNFILLILMTMPLVQCRPMADGITTRLQAIDDLDPLDKEALLAARSLGTDLVSKHFRAGDYFFLGLGRSPTPVLAAIDTFNSFLDTPISYGALPLSRFKDIGELSLSQIETLFAHFDRYFLSAYSQGVQIRGVPSQGIVVVDYVFEGLTASHFLRYFRLYLNYRQIDMPLHFAMLSREGLPAFKVSEEISKAYHQPYKIPSGTQPSPDQLAFIDSMNQNLPHLHDVHIKYIDVSAYRFANDDTLNDYFLKSAFDHYAPYGQWILDKATPEASARPAVREEYLLYSRSLQQSICP